MIIASGQAWRYCMCCFAPMRIAMASRSSDVWLSDSVMEYLLDPYLMMLRLIFPCSSVTSWYKTEPVPTKLASTSIKIGLVVSSSESFGALAIRFFSSWNDFIWMSFSCNWALSDFPLIAS